MPHTHPRTRILAVIAIAIAAFLAPVAPASARVAKPAGPALTIETKSCNTGTDAAERFIVLTASAVLRDTGDEVQMRFTMQQRATTKTTWRSVFAKTGELGVWATSDAGADGLRYTKTINGLAEGNQYRVLIEARGIATGGKVVTKVTRKTFTCIQPQLSPHIVPVRATYIPPSASQPNAIIKTFIRNTGKADSGPLTVTVRDAATQTVLGTSTFDRLAGHKSTILATTIDSCPSTVTVTTQEQGADPTTLTPDQSLTVACAAPTASPAQRATRR